MWKEGFCGDVCTFKLRVQLINLSSLSLEKKWWVLRKQMLFKEKTDSHFEIFLRLCFFVFLFWFRKVGERGYFYLSWTQYYKDRQMLIYSYIICPICESSATGMVCLALTRQILEMQSTVKIVLFHTNRARSWLVSFEKSKDHKNLIHTSLNISSNLKVKNTHTFIIFQCSFPLSISLWLEI